MGNVPSTEDHISTSDLDEDEVEDDLAAGFDPVLDLRSFFNVHSLASLYGKIIEAPVKDAIMDNKEELISWLRDGCNRNVEMVSQALFCEFLSSKSVKTEDCSKAFQKFDPEGDLEVDRKELLNALRVYSNDKGSEIIGRTNTVMKKCSFSPGFVDVYTNSSVDMSKNAARILEFLIRNRAASDTFPCPQLQSVNKIMAMRQAVLTANYAELAERGVYGGDEDVVYETKKCVISLEASSNSEGINRLLESTNSGPWTSAGSPGSHWLRLKMAKGVLVKSLHMKVCFVDSSYTPSKVAVYVGSNRDQLLTHCEVNIARNAAEDVVLLKDAKVYYPIIEIRILKCHSEGCDTKVHGIKVVGFRRCAEQTVIEAPPVGDVLVSWYMQILASTATACLTFMPQLKDSILQHTRNALEHLPPLSLSPDSTVRPISVSRQALEDIETFLNTVSKQASEAELVDWLQALLRFCTARGSVASMLTTLTQISKIGKDLNFGQLLRANAVAVQSLIKSYGHSLKMALVGCDGDSKSDDLPATNVFLQSSGGYVSADGVRKVNMVFKHNSDQPDMLITKICIEVDRGSRGAKRGLIFLLTNEKQFDFPKDLEKFSIYDSWQDSDFTDFKKQRSANKDVVLDGPVGYFHLQEEECDFTLALPHAAVARFILVKFLEPRNVDTQNLQVTRFKVFGLKKLPVMSVTSTDIPDSVHPDIIVHKSLSFLQSVLTIQPSFEKVASGQPKHLDMNKLSVELVWTVYNQLTDQESRVQLLQILHSSLPYLLKHPDTNMVAVHELFQYLCSLIDSGKSDDDLLTKVATSVIVDGAAIFCPDQAVRHTKLMELLKSSSQLSKSSELTLQSLCQFFSSDTGAADILRLPATASELQNFDQSSVLNIVGMLLTIANAELTKKLSNKTQSSGHLERMMCALQTHLVFWCHQQLSAGEVSEESSAVVQNLVVKYVSSVCENVSTSLKMLTDTPDVQKEDIKSAAEGSIVSTLFPQMILILNPLLGLLSSQMRARLLRSLKLTVRSLHTLLIKQDGSQLEIGESEGQSVLKIWQEESPHNYHNDQNITKTFACVGAAEFVVEFDERCQTERTYDYLEFSDSRGTTKKFDEKVNTSKWPKVVTFRNCSRLDFRFHSDGSGTEWGYKFKVIARGAVSFSLSWIQDISMSLSILLGRLCSATLDNKMAGLKGVTDELLQDELWSTLFRGGITPKTLERSFSMRLATDPNAPALCFLLSLKEKDDKAAQAFLSALKEQSPHTTFIGGPEIDEIITSVFTALLWHTPSLHTEIEKYVRNSCSGKICVGIHQAFTAAESLRTPLAQRLQAQKAAAAEDSGKLDIDFLRQMNSKAELLLQFAGCTEVQSAVEMKPKLSRGMSSLSQHSTDSSVLLTESILEKFPTFRLVLDFIQDPSWSTTIVEQVIKHRSQHAEAVAEVYLFLSEFLQLMSEEHMFQVGNVLLLRELLQRQDSFQRHYAKSIDGCGLKIEADVRRAYYSLLKRLTDGLRQHPRNKLPENVTQYYEYIAACLLHLLDIGWQLYDLPLLKELKIPDILLDIAIEFQPLPKEKTTQRMCKDFTAEEYAKHLQWLAEFKSSSMPSYESPEEYKEIKQCKARYSTLVGSYRCDGCSSSCSFRYRCLECEDVDICAKCFEKGEIPSSQGHVGGHDIVHFSHVCIECQGFIVGTRVHCLVCTDVNLCNGCFNDGKIPQGHTAEHEVEKLPTYVYKQIEEEETPCNISSYNFYHAMLLYSSVAFSTGAIVFEKRLHSLNSDYVSVATHLFAHCVQLSIDKLTDDSLEIKPNLLTSEKLIGLLAAVLPFNTKISKPEVNDVLFSPDTFRKLFGLLRVNSEINRKTQLLALGLIGKLLQRISSAKMAESLQLADESQTEDDSRAVLKSFHGIIPHLFSFGTSSFQRDGLEWLKSIVVILRSLFVSDTWNEILMHQLTKSLRGIRALADRDEDSESEQNASLMSVLALYVASGFPEITLMGSRVRYVSRPSNESKEGVVLELVENKDVSKVIEVVKRRMSSVDNNDIEEISVDVNVLREEHVSTFIEFLQIKVKSMKSGKPNDVESAWLLALVIKCLMNLFKSNCACDASVIYQRKEFTELVIYLAQLGTELEKKWQLRDLEIASLVLYVSQLTTTASVSQYVKRVVLTADDSDVVDSAVDNGALIDDIDNEDVREAFRILADTESISPSILRALYDLRGGNALLENLDVEEVLNPGEDILKRAKELRRQKSIQVTNEESDSTIDQGLVVPQLSSLPDSGFSSTVSQSTSATEIELIDDNTDNEKELTGYKWLLTAADSSESERTKKMESSALLKQALTLCEGTPDAIKKNLVKFNQAVAILYARRLLIELLAKWPADQPLTTADLGCSDEKNLPYVLDLLYCDDLKDKFYQVVNKILTSCQPARIATMAGTSCDFIDDFMLIKIVKETPPNHNGTFEETVCIPGTTKLKVHFDNRSCTDEDDSEGACKLIIASDSDYSSDVHTFSGPCENWKDFEFKGNSLYYKFTGNMQLATSWGYKFTVSGSNPGSFHVGHSMLVTLLDMQSVFPLLPVDTVWQRLVIITCRQKQQKRLQLIQLLLKLLHMCMENRSSEQPASSAPLALGLLKPLWHLYHRLSSKRKPDSSQLITPLMQALAELFVAVESAAKKWDIVNEYLEAVDKNLDKETVEPAKEDAADADKDTDNDSDTSDDDD